MVSGAFCSTEMRSNEKCRVPLLSILCRDRATTSENDKKGLWAKDLIRMGKKQEASSVAVVEVASVDEIWGGRRVVNGQR